jgi:hypothetical protein
MADGRVVAHGAGDTESGAFTCVLRRAQLRNRLRYHIHFENSSGMRAGVAVSRGTDPLQTMAVPAHSSVDVAFTVADHPSAAQIVIDIRCGRTTIRVVEPTRAGEAVHPRRLLVIAVIAAALTGAVVAGLAFLAWHVLRRIAPKRTVPPPPPWESYPLATIRNENEDSAAPSEPAETGEVLGPEAVRPKAEHATAGVTYDARPVGHRPRFGTALAVGVTGAVIVLAFMIAHPHVADLGAPNEVLQGSAIDVPYASSGVGALSFRVSSLSGVVIAGGELPARTGTLHIPIPIGRQDEAYRIQLTLAGPLGDARNDATVNAHAVPQARIITRIGVVPNIRSFAVTRSTVNGVRSMVAFYDVSADRGTVRLVDSRGIQYGVAALKAGGQARFQLPDGVDSGTLAVELHVVRGAAAADSRIALPSAQDGIAIAARPASSEGSNASDSTPIIVPATSIGRAPIRVRIVQHYPDLHLALIDSNARKIVGVVVPRNARVMTLPHPPVAAATRVTVQATYRVNNESDTVIRPVILVPAPGG